MSAEATVHVIDDDEAMRDSLAFLFQTANVPVRTYESAASFLAILPDVRSGCVVTDIRMPEIDGLELLRRLKKMDVHLPVIVITGHGDVPLAVEAMRLGASDFLEKPFDDDVLMASIRAALAKEHEDGRRHGEQAEVMRRVATLSQRERQVLDGLVAGKPNKVIAYDLNISPHTIEIYRANVMTKMQAVSLSALVRMALSANLADDPASPDKHPKGSADKI
jgi:two-component system, LuxR family, response regulator FixJ